jgi:hypothetical protein
MSNNTNSGGSSIGQIVLLLISLFTGILGYHINVVANSEWPKFWAVMDFFFWFFAWVKWICYGQVNLTVIKDAFAWFLQ